MTTQRSPMVSPMSRWPRWLPFAPSPAAFASGRGLSPLAYGFAALAVVIVCGLFGAVLSKLATHRAWAVVAPWVLAAVPWVGLATTRWLRSSSRGAVHWLRVVGWLTPGMLFMAGLMSHDKEGIGVRALGITFVTCTTMALLAFAVSAVAMGLYNRVDLHGATWRTRARVALALTGLLLTGAAVRTATEDVSAVVERARPYALHGETVTVLRGRGQCWLRDGHQRQMAWDCARPAPTAVVVADRAGRWGAFDPFAVFFALREAPVVPVGGRYVSTSGVPVEAFLGASPRAEFVIGGMLAWAAMLVTGSLLTRRMRAWRGLAWEEATVTGAALLTAEGRAFPRPAGVGPEGARVLVWSPPQVVTYRAATEEAERVFVGDRAGWDETLSQAEGLAWKAVTLSCVGAAAVVAMELLSVAF